MLNAVVERVLKLALRCARQALYRKWRTNRHDKAAGESGGPQKSRDFWFALIPVVRPHTNEFFLVNSAVFCRLGLALNLSQQFSHPTLPQ
jgi:hypothetical protein